MEYCQKRHRVSKDINADESIPAENGLPDIEKVRPLLESA
jgi:hypothetical protein